MAGGITYSILEYLWGKLEKQKPLENFLKAFVNVIY
jgi:hypothetical protein